MSIVRLAAAALIVPLTLTACGQSETPEATPAGQTVARQEANPPAEAPVPPPPAAVIQTQAGDAGVQVALTRAAVVGDVLTVQLSYVRPATPGTKVVRFAIDQVSVIDNATSQRLGVLKDAAGRWQASPIGAGDQDVHLNVTDQPSVVWFKFPAPPATSPTVSINIPSVGPFDGVPVTR